MDAEALAILERICVALERLADVCAPEEIKRERRPAVLSTAKYTREERDREELRKTLRSKKPQPQG